VKPTTPRLEFLSHATVDVDPPQVVGQTPTGERRIVTIRGGRLEGRLNGEVLPGGADWQIVTADGTGYLEARYTVRTPEGALIYVRNYGVRHGPPDVLAQIAAGELVDPSKYYFRSAPKFETGDPRYDWLNKIIAVCSGARTAREVLLDFYEVL
jgi:hypothetical protein